jgi:hypothetical protein
MLGSLVNNIRYIPLGSKRKGFGYIKYFRRSIMMRLLPGVDVPYQLKLPYKQDLYTVYIGANSNLRCERFKKIGHSMRSDVVSKLR